MIFNSNVSGPLLQWPRPRTPSAYNGGIVCQSTDSKHVMEPSGATQADEACNTIT